MTRNRPFASLYECINPEYLKGWYYPVTVKDAIDVSLHKIVTKAIRKRNRGYEVRVLLPDYNGKKEILQHIFTFLSKEFSSYPYIRLAIVDEEIFAGDIVIEFVAMTLHPIEGTIAIRWEDLLEDWTWCDVVENGGLYTSSSSDIWPPAEYKMRADREKLRHLRSNYFA